MASNIVTEAIQLLEKANANLEPELLTAESARRLLDEYARAEKLASYGKAVPARRVDDAAAVARATGTSMGVAKKTVETGAALADAPEVGDALARGEVSLDQAGEIAKAEKARPGSATELLSVARDESFHVLREKARTIRLEAEQSRASETASGPPEAPAATPTISEWSTSTCGFSPTSGPRSSTAPTPKQIACIERQARKSRSSATWPTPTPRCCPARARDGLRALSSLSS